MALETVPESTIIESTTMSGAIGSRPRCATSIPVRVLRSSTALMLEEPTSSPTIVFDPIPNMCPPLSTEFAYGVPAAFTAALIFFLPRGSSSIDFTSIHSSSFDFLKRQRLPNLNAGIFCSFTYLYNVSGLTPRYCEAWRIFITSRDSAMTLSSSTEFNSRNLSSRLLRVASRKHSDPQQKRVRVSFGVLSISQREARASQRESPRFVGFYGVFLELRKSVVADNCYM